MHAHIVYVCFMHSHMAAATHGVLHARAQKRMLADTRAHAHPHAHPHAYAHVHVHAHVDTHT